MVSMYKCFTSASTFFQSICDIMNVVSYIELLKYSFHASFIYSASSMPDCTSFTFCFGSKLV